MTQRLFLPVLCASLVLSFHAVGAESPHAARLEQTLLNPGMVMRFAAELGLDETQHKAIQEEMMKSREKFATLQGNLEKEVVAMNTLLQQNAIDEQKAMAQLDRVLDAEKEIKHAHLALSLAIRSKLTAEQQAKVRELQEKMFAQSGHPGDGAQAGRDGSPAIKEKMQRLQERLTRAHQEGRDMTELQPIMQEISSAMHQGKYKEVEPLIDKAMKLLGEGEKK